MRIRRKSGQGNIKKKKKGNLFLDNLGMRIVCMNTHKCMWICSVRVCLTLPAFRVHKYILHLSTYLDAVYTVYILQYTLPLCRPYTLYTV